MLHLKNYVLTQKFQNKKLKKNIVKNKPNNNKNLLQN